MTKIETLKRTGVGAIVISAFGLGAVADFEGFREKAYLDPVGVPTIGYGTTFGVRIGDTVTLDEARNYLVRDMDIAEDAIKRCVKVPLLQREYDAYASFIYNLGGKAFCDSTMVKILNAGDYTGACNQLPRWVYAKGKKLPGLVKRREVERRMCLGLAND